MLFHALKAPESGVYIEQYCCQLRGALDPGALREAWAEATQAHPVLRTAFLWDGIDEPLQVVRQKVTLSWQEENWQSRSATDKENALTEFLAADRRRGFAVQEAPLQRIALFRLEPDTWQLVWTFHHLISDGWSTALLLKDIFKRYDARVSGTVYTPLEVPPFRDYIAWLGERNAAETRQFWEGYLAGIEEPTPLPGGPEEDGGSGYGEQEVFLSPELSRALVELAREKRLTLNTVLLGAWALLLNGYSGSTEPVFGTTVSGRPAELNGVENMIGMFINTLPMRVSIDPHSTLDTFLASVQSDQISLRQFEGSSLVKIREWAGFPAERTLFESIVVFENYPIDENGEGLSRNLNIGAVRYREQSNFPLALLVVPGESLRLILVFDRTRISERRGQQILDHLEVLLGGFVENPGGKIGEISMLTAKELDQLSAWEKGTDLKVSPLAVHRQIEAICAKGGRQPALVCADQTLSYQDLNTRANRLAAFLNHGGIGSGQRVGILLERGPEMIVAMVAVLKSGAAYVPLDPTHPANRLNSLATGAGLSAVICNAATDVLLADNLRTVNLDLEAAAIAAREDANPEADPAGSDTAYIIFTSGSTGTPKGVMVTHDNLRHSNGARLAYYPDPAPRFLLLSGITFDSSVAGIYGTLAKGGTLIIPEQTHYQDIDYLGRLAEAHRANHLLAIPSLYALLLERCAGQLSGLKTAIVAGEACGETLVASHLETLPECRLVNEYGPSEATVWSTVFDCGELGKRRRVPIGRPIPNSRAYVLDAQGRRVAPGLPGELCLGGPGIAAGYLNQAELTRERFIPNPFVPGERLYRTGDRASFLPDGNLAFLGRTDHQIKLRGFRIEPGEIEAVLAAHPAVSEALVLPGQSGTRDQKTGIGEVARLLAEMPEEAAEMILHLLEESGPPAPGATPANSSKQEESGQIWRQPLEGGEILLRLENPDFIRPPRENQREWLIRQALRELSDNLGALDRLSRFFVKGATEKLDQYDITESVISEDHVMEDWQIPVMQAMADQVCGTGNDVLEIGFGRGISAGMLQAGGVKSHTIIESNPAVIERFYQPWLERQGNRDIRLIEGRWQEVQHQLGEYDGVFFHAFPLNEAEFVEYVLNSSTFAEHFFPHAATVLRPGGVFTYLSTEIDSLSRRHQRALFQHFSSLTLSVLPVRIPENTVDTWWANSMVIVKAVK
ncbi:MAG: amino acid adenylation domain-containing protein [Calditrichaeota bacterium]|nr:amino acid adenylation domain-containing protein [Calditrichota bacterium]